MTIVSRLWLQIAEQHEAHYASGEPLCGPLYANKALSIGIRNPLDSAELERYVILAEKLRKRGYHIRPFLRLADFPLYSDWWSAEWWAVKNAQLTALHIIGERIDDLDYEAYYHQSPKVSYPEHLLLAGGSEAMMRSAIESSGFADTLGAIEAGSAYPAATVDVMTRVLDEACGKSAMHLVYEGHMKYAGYVRTDIATARLQEIAMARTRSRSEILFPGRPAKHQMTEAILCRWGRDAYNDLISHGPYHPQVFLSDRSDERTFGFQGWSEGLDQGVGNKITGAWWPAKGTTTGLVKYMNGHRANYALPAAGDWRIRACEVPNTMTGVILSGSQKNFGWWQLSRSADFVQMTVMGPTTEISSVPMHLPAGSPFILQRVGERLQLYRSTMPDSWAMPKSPPSGGHLYIGAGVIGPKLEDGTQLQITHPRVDCNGIGSAMVKCVEVAAESLPPEHIAAVLAEEYPRGSNE